MTARYRAAGRYHRDAGDPAGWILAAGLVLAALAVAAVIASAPGLYAWAAGVVW